VGTIAVDSIYSPVQRVAFHVNSCRLGKRTDFEALDLEIWTDGSITPELALVEATNILRKHLNPFVKYFELGRELEGGSSVDLVIEGDTERTALRAANIKLIADLVVMDEAEVAAIRNLGKIASKELKKKLADRGLSFGMRLGTKAEA
jgi:DNA-directed RNA polymerase subunit alpha